MVDIFSSEVLKGDGRLNFFAAQLYFSTGFQLTGTMHSTSLPTSCKIAHFLTSQMFHLSLSKDAMLYSDMQNAKI